MDLLIANFCFLFLFLQNKILLLPQQINNPDYFENKDNSKTRPARSQTKPPK